MTKSLKASKLTPNGRRAPGCAVKGCGNQPRRGVLICDVHAQALQAIPQPAPGRGTRGTSRSRGATTEDSR